MKLTIGQKIACGFGVVLLSMCAIGGVSYRTNSQAASSLISLERAAELDSHVSEAGESVRMFQFALADYRANQSEENATATRSSLAKATEKLSDVTKEAQGSPLSVQVDKLAQSAEVFFNASRKEMQANELVNTRITKGMHPNAAELTKDFQKLASGGSTRGMLAENRVLQARTIALRLVTSGDVSTRVNANTQLDAAIEAANALGDEAGDIAEHITAYKTAFNAAADTIETRNNITRTELDPAKVALEAAFVTVGDAMKASNNDVKSQAKATMSTANMLTLVIAGIALSVGMALAIFMSRSMSLAIAPIVARAREIAANNLTGAPLVARTNDELKDLTESINMMSTSLRGIVAELSTASHEVAGGATQIAASSEEISASLSRQSEQVGQIAAAVTQVSASASEVSQKAANAVGAAGRAGDVATEGGTIVGQTVSEMTSIAEAVELTSTSVQELGARGVQIGQIISVINDIADQTNLLALNAAIEAARAGEHGRGFAVVADEVRKLADRTTKATAEIGESIAAIQGETTQAVDRMKAGTDKVQSGVERASAAGKSLKQIVHETSEVNSLIRSIAAAAGQQASATEEISRSVESISAVSQQAVEGAQQATEAASHLSNKAEGLRMMLARFKC